MIRPAASFFCAALLASLAQTSANSPMPTEAGSSIEHVPADTVLLAKLDTELDLRQSRTADQVRAETTEDVKAGKTILLKKGSLLAGYVSFVEPESASQPDNTVGIEFDRVVPKDGREQSLHLIVRALAPQARAQANSTPSSPYPQATSVAPLSASSVGVSSVPGLRLGVRRSATGHQTTVLAWTKGDVKLRKGSQLTMAVISE